MFGLIFIHYSVAMNITMAGLSDTSGGCGL